MAADLSRDDLLAAREAIAGRLHRTPMFSSAILALYNTAIAQN